MEGTLCTTTYSQAHGHTRCVLDQRQICETCVSAIGGYVETSPTGKEKPFLRRLMGNYCKAMGRGHPDPNPRSWLSMRPIDIRRHMDRLDYCQPQKRTFGARFVRCACFMAGGGIQLPGRGLLHGFLVAVNAGRYYAVDHRSTCIKSGMRLVLKHMIGIGAEIRPILGNDLSI